MPATSANAVDAQTLLAQLKPRKQSDKLYMLLDAARDSKIHLILDEFNQKFYRSLFTSKVAQDLATVSPYLLQLNLRANVTKTLLEESWGKGWGIFLESSANFKQLYRQFQSLLLVKDESGQIFHFRFYDPRVLQVYLPTCNTIELDQLFGSVSHFYLENETEGELISYSYLGSKLLPDTTTLTST